MKITVVIPAYNEEKYLPFCLESLQKQSFRDFEIIIVDNGSTDRTSEIAKKFETQLLHEPKKGVGAARKKGFSEAKNDIIVSTDADCIFPENWLLKIAQTFEKNPEAVAVYGIPIIRNSSPIQQKIYEWIIGIFYRINDMFGKKQFPGLNFAVKKEAYRKTSGINEALKALEDADLCKKLMQIGKIHYDPSVKVMASGRRFEIGNPMKNLWMYLVWYYRTWWQNDAEKAAHDLPMEDYR